MTVLEMQPERFSPLDGCNNFRDLGGHGTASGTTIRWRRLFRSDSLTGASPNDRTFFRVSD